MPIVPITITNNSPSVTITTASPSLSYEQILYTLNQTAYDVKALNLQAQSISQLSEPITYTKRDINGEVYSENLSPAIDTDQIQAALNDLACKNLILDALSTYSFNLEPNEIYQLIFDVDQFSIWDIRGTRNSMTDRSSGEVVTTGVIKPERSLLPLIVAASLIGLGFVFFYPGKN